MRNIGKEKKNMVEFFDILDFCESSYYILKFLISNNIKVWSKEMGKTLGN